MRRRVAVGVFVIAALGLVAVVASSGPSESIGTISRDFSRQPLKAEERYLGEEPFAGTPFQLVTLEGLDVAKRLGEPCLPVEVVHVYVPRGKTIARVVIESQESRTLPGEYLLLPGQREVPMSSLEPAADVLPDPEIYAMTSPHPASAVALASVGNMAGRKIASIKVFPLQYVPAEGRLLLNYEISFRVELADADFAEEPALPAETPSVARLRNAVVEGMVENAPAVAADFPEEAATLAGPTAVEYLIICHENHIAAYTPLKDWKTRKGVPAGIITWQEILASYSGRDGAEKFRNCIKDYYLNHGTAWVTIGGAAMKAYDYLRGCYCDVWGTVDDFIPCDLYFSDLDGTWNSDNDSDWGEVADGTDLYPDVYVGRLPENTAAQCSTAVRKVLTYEGCYTLPADYQLKMLFMGEWLDDETDAAINKNMIDNESVSARFDPIQKLYESSGNLTHSAAISALSSGKNIVNHDGHGNVTIISIGSSLLTMDDFMSLTNAPRYTVFYTLACDPAAFDGVGGCLGRSFVESPAGGGFFVGNSRYGWYWPGASGYGTGDLFDREFFKSIFVRGYTNLGVIHADAKVQRIPYSGYDDTDRWTQFSMNLLGDPETPVWTNTPGTLSVSHSTEIETGGQTFTVSVASGGSPLSAARVCLWKGDDLYAVSQTASGGSVAFSIAPADTGTMLVTATKNGYLPYKGSAHVADGTSGVAGEGLGGAVALRITPNPTSGPTTLYFDLTRGRAAKAGEVVVAVYDAGGRRVASLKSDSGPAGRVTWDGRTSHGGRVPPGIYFLRASYGETTAETKLVVLR